MMNQLDLIKQILKQDYFINSDILEERNKDKSGKEFRMIRKIKSHKDIKYLLFRLDPDKVSPFPYFNRNTGLSKICDYIIFVQKRKALFILLVELKLGTESASNQLISSEEFAKFIINSGKRTGIDFTEDMHFRKIKISEAALSRQKTATDRCTKDENEIIHYNHKNEFQIMEILHL